MKNKKIIVCFLAVISASFAKPYIGFSTSVFLGKTNGKFNGTDNTLADYDFSQNINQSINAFAPGFIIGKNFACCDVWSANVEFDAFLFNKSVNKENLVTFEPGTTNQGQLNETLTVQKKADFGLTTAVVRKINPKFSALGGVRFSASKYKLSVKSFNSISNLSESSLSLGIEPHVGAVWNMSNVVKLRGTVGYVFAQKLNLKRYINPADAPVEASFTVKPSGFAARVALTYTFG